MTTSHTPGPWKFSTSEDGWSNTIHVAQVDGAPYTPDYSDVGYIIQTCRGEKESIQMANARLIAAAPELLEVLQVIAADSRWTSGEPLLMQARAAIVKATGAA